MIAGTHYNYATARHERDRRHMAEIAARRPEELGSLIFNALGPERLKALSDELPILHIAVSSNQLWAARALLNAGADPNRDHPGRGLAAAKVSGCEMLGVLISHGAKLTQRDAQGNYPLQASKKYSDGRQDRLEKTIRWLGANGIDWEARDAKGVSDAGWLAARGSAQRVIAALAAAPREGSFLTAPWPRLKRPSRIG